MPQSAPNNKLPDISVVIPVFNEAGNIERLYARLESVMNDIGMSREYIFVDDGSIDGSLAILKELNKKDQRVKVVSFSRNFGHQIALTAGLDHSIGKATICMDADLQHPPELIPTLVDYWKKGYDVVYTVRTETQKATFLKTLTSKFFYWAINKIAHTNIPENAADFRLISRRAVDVLKNIKERDRFLRGLVCWIGFNQIAVPYVAQPRLHGKSKYSFIRMLRFALDGMTSFSSAPLYAATFLGLVVSLLSFFYGVFVLYARLFTDRSVPGWTSIITLILFLGGVQLVCVGIMGEYVGRIFNEVKRRPLYLIRESKGFANDA